MGAAIDAALLPVLVDDDGRDVEGPTGVGAGREVPYATATPWVRAAADIASATSKRLVSVKGPG